MKTPAFWTQPPGPLAAALWPFSLVYGKAAAVRLTRAKPTRAPVPVVCVGNVVAGGQGKTPAALAIASLLEAGGRRPAFLTRGHGGRLVGPAMVDPACHSARDVGDEPLLLARAAPTIVARDRLAGAGAAAALGADVIVMDDGFQNPRLAKDLSLIVTDSGFGLGNGFCLPAGPLRAPLDDQLAQADALILVGDGSRSDRLVALATERALPVFRARLQSDSSASALAGARVLAFAGIGRPEKFFETLQALGAEVVDARAFPDHHVFSAAETNFLLKEARRLDARLVTTEKDFVRLGGSSEPFRRAVHVLPVRLVFEEEPQLQKFLLKIQR